MHEREELFRAKKIDSDLLVTSTVNDLRLKIDNEFGGRSYATFPSSSRVSLPTAFSP